MRGLGELEATVMDLLWATDRPLLVREVRETLEAHGRPLAYTTVMTVLDKLHGKDWVRRERVGRAWAYRPAHSRAEAGAQVLREVLDASGDPERVLLHFARTISRRESALLRRALGERPEGS
ncbi:BlaI/MecI/CopY family transcriptional regulator [Pseudonocardia asaccharolytica]|uniref:Penicillinase repressor n=1 Tax=Pseudonocardia asaccharolytica DSM 44247 = NBRC 16224 TaxID=1123024 RepID=A0A511D769_9PSEU|nr:BlaI/MecI/CopY family transcriptional regulator [Pseudonocardia asaccharolytica]GEL20645.1 penicillinase repressor [Pseudonocardia asaccharolytica DSM 44247 = NBRC 16224]